MSKVRTFFKDLGDKIKNLFKRKKSAKNNNVLETKAPKEDKNAKPKMRWGWRYTFVILLWAFAMAPWLIFWTQLETAKSEGLPSTKELENPKSKEASEVFSADGESMGKYFAENRTPITFAELSPYLVDALISTEDERYYKHSGVDVWALPRVAQGVLTGNESSGGGSTISQQLAKMLFSKRDFTGMGKMEKLKALINVKLREWVMATELERKFTKEEIITMYFNKFDFLHNAVGVHSAAKVYFNTTPDSLSIIQAATLVGMAKNPSVFDPLRNPDTTKHRRNVVLGQWLKNSKEGNPAIKNKITQEQFDTLKQAPLVLDYQLVDHQRGIAPYFREILREAVVDTLANIYFDDYKLMKKVLSESEYADFKDSLKVLNNAGLKRGAYRREKKKLMQSWAKYMIYNKGLRIYTTLDAKMQRYGEYAVKEYLKTELQAQFERQQEKRLKDEYPFDLKRNFYKKAERDSVINHLMVSSMRRSDRWHNMKRAGVSKAEREEAFHKPVRMKIFSWEGDIDTVMTPWDSIRYHKKFLHAGMMAMDPRSGYVKAWVGGADFYRFKFDHVIKSRRQVGSTFKPFVYAMGIKSGKITPCTEVPNIEYCVDIPYNKYRNKQWCPKGSKYNPEEMISMKRGLGGSMNNITAYVMREVGAENVAKNTWELGLDSTYVKPVPALALGIADLTVYEMVGAQSSWVNNGVYIKPIIISRIEDNLGNVVYDADPYMKEVFDEQSSYLTLQLMKGVVDGGTASSIRYPAVKSRPWSGIKHPMAGKTGTTQNGSDGWFIGLTPDLVTGVWVGHEDRAIHFPDINWGQGARMALPIYGYFMQKVYADPTIKISTEDFEKPSIHIPEELWWCTPSNTGDDGPIDYGGGDDEDMPFPEGS